MRFIEAQNPPPSSRAAYRVAATRAMMGARRVDAVEAPRVLLNAKYIVHINDVVERGHTACTLFPVVERDISFQSGVLKIPSFRNEPSIPKISETTEGDIIKFNVLRYKFLGHGHCVCLVVVFCFVLLSFFPRDECPRVFFLPARKKCIFSIEKCPLRLVTLIKTSRSPEFPRCKQKSANG